MQPALSPEGTLTYTPAPGVFGTATVIVTLVDSGSGAPPHVNSSALQSFALTIEDTNDAPGPSATPASPLAVAENSAVGTLVTAIAANDPDAGQSHTYALQSGNTNSAFAIDGSGQITVASTLDFEGSDDPYSLVVRVSDNGVPALFADIAIEIALIDQNEAPAVTAGGTLAYTEGQGAAVVDSSVAVTDPDTGEGIQSATVQITNNLVSTEDTLGFVDGGGISGSYAPGTGTLTLTGNATPAAYQAALRSVRYSNSSNAPSALPRTVSWSVDDGVLPSNVATSIITVAPIASAPVVTGSAGALAYSEGSGAQVFDPSLDVSDADSTQLSSASVRIAVAFQTGEDLLSCPGCGGAISAAFVGDTLSLSGTDTLANYVAALQSVRYTNSSDTPSTSTRTVAVVATDDSSTASAAFTRDIAISASNDAPVNIVPGAQQVADTATLTFSTGNGNALSVSDADVGAATTFRSTVSIGAGTLSATASGATLVGNGSSSVQITGTLAQINAALEGLTYDPVDATTSSQTLTLLSDDQGNTGGAAETDSDTVTVNVDQAPSFVSSVPADAATNVLPSANLSVTFSEAVSFAASDFTIDCGGTQAFALSGSGTATALLNPIADLPPGTSCTLTVLGAAIADSDVVDPLGAQVVGGNTVVSFTTAAIANDDSYSATPHLTLGVAAGVQGGAVVANDQLGAAVITGFGSNSPAGTCSGTAPAGSSSTALGGTVSLNGDGSFQYRPPVAARNTVDSFCYTITGGDTAVVTLALANTALVWFVDAAAAPGGSGTQAAPFQQFGGGVGTFEGSASDLVGDTIFLRQGTYSGGVTLLANQRLVGDGAGSTLAAISGVTPVAGASFPAFSGSAPVLSTGSGADNLVVSAGGITLRGLTVGDSGGATGDSSDIVGTNFGTLTVHELRLNGTGRTLNLTTGTVAGSALLDLISTAATSGGLTLNGVGGALSVATAGSTQISNASAGAIGIDIQNSAASISLDNATVTKTASGSGVTLNANTGTITFATLDVSTSAGTALTADNSTSVVVASGGTLSATGGAALASTNTGWNATFTSVSSTGSPTQGVTLNNITGALNLGSGSIDTPTGVAFLAQGSLGTSPNVISYSGTITKATDGNLIQISGAATGSLTLSGNLSCTSLCDGIDVLNRGAGTITFSGAVKTLNTGTSDAVNLDNNDAATITFTGGGLDIDTTSGRGFSATNGAAAITVQGTSNSIDSGIGIALNVVNSSIGADHLGFRSISSDGATSGIVLNSTGLLGGLRVLGGGGACSTPATCSGGSILNSIGPAVDATGGTQDLQLTRMFLGNPRTHGISATNLRGTGHFNHGVISDWDQLNTSTSNGIHIVNSGANLNSFSVDGTLIDGTGASNDGLFMEAQGTSNMTLLVTNSTFTQIFGDAIQINGISGATGAVIVSVQNSTFTNADAEDSPGVGGGNGGISLQPFGDITFSALVENNTFDDIMRPVTNLGAVGGTNGLTADASITVRGNTLDNIRGSRGVTFAADGSGFTSLVIDDNDIDRLGSTTKYAISVNMITANGSVEITNNRIGQASALWDGGNGTAEAVFLLTQNASALTSFVSGNVISANASLEVIRARAIGTSTQEVTYQSNTVTDTVGTHVGELAVRTEGSATLCLNATGNVLPSAGVGVILLSESAGAVNVVQSSSATLSSLNSGATVNQSGTPSYGVPACAVP
jgi:hypothetical protein